jgi:hypothetical protein
MLPNMVMMAFVSYFFAGFILVKVGFHIWYHMYVYICITWRLG